MIVERSVSTKVIPWDEEEFITPNGTRIVNYSKIREPVTRGDYAVWECVIAKYIPKENAVMERGVKLCSRVQAFKWIVKNIKKPAYIYCTEYHEGSTVSYPREKAGTVAHKAEWAKVID